MKQTVVAFFLAMLLAASPASAFIHFTQNEFTTAESLDPGMTQTGIHFTLGEDYKTYYAGVRYGVGALAEIGAKFGAVSADFGEKDKLGAIIGIDLKYQLIKETEGIPLDMAMDIGYDNTIINSKNASEVTFSTIFSRSLPLTDRGYKLVPYGGLEMSAIYGSAVPRNDTSIYLLAGIEWKLSQKFMLLLEYKGGDANLGGFGVRLEKYKEQILALPP
jgi:hypothetical protein